MQPDWSPSPNPAGRNRQLIRETLKAWLDAARIAGIDHLYPGEPVTWQFDLYKRSASGVGCLVGILLGSDSEDRAAYTGPTDPGGKMVTYAAELRVEHVTYQVDAGDAGMSGENDRDRIVDALKDALRGAGRDLGRPDVVLTTGEWPREGSITGDYPPLVVDGDGVVRRTCTIAFNITQYLPPTVPEEAP